ncbi:hypothetical protein E2C01_060052 [Portunus trituberculatus]|uniref:Uncharacterized protein n=1 Tax=Portunus trituberculatus TaxID=210409 RepID=A0A5B7H893_PORTR|nr:hypothetical protein [Portunus trituberculatus]
MDYQSPGGHRHFEEQKRRSEAQETLQYRSGGEGGKQKKQEGEAGSVASASWALPAPAPPCLMALLTAFRAPGHSPLPNPPPAMSPTPMNSPYVRPLVLPTRPPREDASNLHTNTKESR